MTSRCTGVPAMKIISNTLMVLLERIIVKGNDASLARLFFARGAAAFGVCGYTEPGYFAGLDVVGCIF